MEYIFQKVSICSLWTVCPCFLLLFAFCVEETGGAGEESRGVGAQRRGTQEFPVQR